MPYYIRVLGSQDPDIYIDEFIDALKKDGLAAKFELDPNEQPGKWTMVDILNQDGKALAQIERNPVIDGELGQEELNEFREIIQEYKPTSAVQWLTNYFDNVKVVYAFQMLNAAFDDSNFEIISSIKATIWHKTKGILQADNEGFSNEDGYHILWQFSDNVIGEWSCAVNNSAGNWDNFVMDLADITQRKEFQNGNVPKNARRI
ncbi:MAG TPA: hypothetical protein VJU78_05935 [Chitinophagaceae bacterium]|nr:hypothetical protein [Chitinophagaceae bacterium]